jgi:hypothetical protein
MQAAHQLDIQQVTAERFEDLAALFRTGLARVCWDMEPRQTAAEDAACRRRWRAEGISRKDGRRQAFLDLLARARMPGLLAYRQGQAVGWVSIGPRSDYPRIEQSWALPPLDDLAVWAIPVCTCIRPSGARASRSRCCGRRWSMRVGAVPRPWKAIRATRPSPSRPRRPSTARWPCSPEPASRSCGRPRPVSPRPGRLATPCGLPARQYADEAGRSGAARTRCRRGLRRRGGWAAGHVPGASSRPSGA